MTAPAQAPAVPDILVTPAAELLLDAWAMYRDTEAFPWDPAVFWARFRLHGLLSPYTDTLSAAPALTKAGEAAIRWAYQQLDEAVARQGEAFMATGGTR